MFDETGLISCETGLVLHETGLVSCETGLISCETGLVLDEITLVSHEAGLVLGRGRRSCSRNPNVRGRLKPGLKAGDSKGEKWD